MTCQRPFQRWTQLLSVFAAALLFAVAPAWAQTTYSNTTPGAVDETATPCTNPLVRNFVVTGSSFVRDVDIGVILTHTYRGDLQMILQSPAGTRVRVFNQTGGGADNFSVMMNDQATTSVTTHVANDVAAGLPYEHNFAPALPLSPFNGQAAAGTWRLEVCDNANVDSGIYLRADLILTTGPAFIDLSLIKTVSNAAPATGSQITYTLAVTNAAGAPLSASNVAVADVLPAGVNFVSATGTGSYASGTGLWTVGSIPAGTTRQLVITVNVTAVAGSSVVNSAQVSSAGEPDIDSTPNNSNTSEDDYGFAALTVGGTRTAGTPPALVCPVDTLVLDWDVQNWTAASLSNSYAIAGMGQVQIALSSPTGFVNLATYGGQTPRLTNVATGGLSPAQLSLVQVINLTDLSSTATTQITLQGPVPGLQFRVFDVDFGAAQFADKLTVTGYNNGIPVFPVLTNGIANYIVGNSAIGDAVSADNSGNGNVVVTFNSAVDSVTLNYGNHSTAPADPGQQGIQLHDLVFCRPLPSLTVVKSESVFNNGIDPPFHTPGNDAQYSITVINSGLGNASGNSLFILDPLPASVTFFNGDANGAAPGTDAVLFTDTGSGLTWTYGTDVRFATTAPTNFAQCTYTPAAGYDVNVRYLCVNPKGTLAGKTGTATPGFTLTFRTRIK